MKITVVSELIDRIKETQTEALKEENWKQNRIKGQVLNLEDDSRGLKTRWGRVWTPPTCTLKTVLLDEMKKFYPFLFGV